MATEPLKIVVGFLNYEDMRVLERGLLAYNTQLKDNGGPGRELKIVAARQDAQKVYDDAVALEADLVLLCPRIAGYRHSLLNELLLHDKKPVPTIGWIPPRSDEGRMMLNNGAKVIIGMPMDDAGIALFVQNAEPVVNQAWQDRASGKAQYGGNAGGGAGDAAYERKSLAVWVPKGGGSTRTTLAVNLAVALSHNALGGRPTVLVDLDMSKGDCHTLLGFAADAEMAARTGQLYLDRCLHTLVTWVARDYGRKNVSAVDAVLINRVLVNWRPGESQLKLLPGLTSPAQAAAEEFANWEMLYDVTRKLLQELRRMGSFVVCDLGQDFTIPLHRAALEEADEVIVPVPPTRTAIVDTMYALPALRTQMGGDLSKFKLVITAYDPNFGISEREIVDLVGLPLLTTIPFEPLVAHTALNASEPFVLTDTTGILGPAVVELAAVYYPGLKGLRQKKLPGLGNIFRRLVVKEA